MTNESQPPNASPEQDAPLLKPTEARPIGQWREENGGWTTIGEGTHPLTVSRDVQQMLVVRLTDEEKARLAEDLAEVNDESNRLLARKKRFATIFKARKEKLDARMANKMTAVRTGTENRIVPAQEVFDHSTKTHYFTHGGARFLERPMKDQEFLVGQPTLFVEPPKDGSPNVTQTFLNGDLVERIATAEDGKVTRISTRQRKAQPPREGMTPVNKDIQDVMREEKSAKTKRDHTT